VREGEAAEKEMEEVSERRDAEIRKCGKFKQREEDVAESEKVLVKIRTRVEIRNETIEDEEGQMGMLWNELKEVSKW
jgi:structural maintenance of chromosome 2